MPLLFFLILFPLIVALALLYLKNEIVRGFIVKISAITIAASALFLAAMNFHRDIQFFKAEAIWFDKSMFYLKILLAACIFGIGLKYKR